MFRKFSSTTLWLLIFVVMVVVQAYSAFGPAAPINRSVCPVSNAL